MDTVTGTDHAMTDHHVMPGHHGAGDDHVYLTLSEAGPELDGEARWAYGTGFSDPLLGVDTTVPHGPGRRRPGRVLPDAR